MIIIPDLKAAAVRSTVLYLSTVPIRKLPTRRTTPPGDRV